MKSGGTTKPQKILLVENNLKTMLQEQKTEEQKTEEQKTLEQLQRILEEASKYTQQLFEKPTQVIIKRRRDGGSDYIANPSEEEKKYATPLRAEDLCCMHTQKDNPLRHSRRVGETARELYKTIENNTESLEVTIPLTPFEVQTLSASGLFEEIKINKENYKIFPQNFRDNEFKSYEGTTQQYKSYKLTNEFEMPAWPLEEDKSLDPANPATILYKISIPHSIALKFIEIMSIMHDLNYSNPTEYGSFEYSSIEHAKEILNILESDGLVPKDIKILLEKLIPTTFKLTDVRVILNSSDAYKKFKENVAKTNPLATLIGIADIGSTKLDQNIRMILEFILTGKFANKPQEIIDAALAVFESGKTPEERAEKWTNDQKGFFKAILNAFLENITHLSLPENVKDSLKSQTEKAFYNFVEESPERWKNMIVITLKKIEKDKELPPIQLNRGGQQQELNLLEGYSQMTLRGQLTLLTAPLFQELVHSLVSENPLADELEEKEKPVKETIDKITQRVKEAIESDKKVLFLIGGDSGGGKSTFTDQLRKNLVQIIEPKFSTVLENLMNEFSLQDLIALLEQLYSENPQFSRDTIKKLQQNISKENVNKVISNLQKLLLITTDAYLGKLNSAIGLYEEGIHDVPFEHFLHIEHPGNTKFKHIESLIKDFIQRTPKVKYLTIDRSQTRFEMKIEESQNPKVMLFEGLTALLAESYFEHHLNEENIEVIRVHVDISNATQLLQRSLRAVNEFGLSPEFDVSLWLGTNDGTFMFDHKYIPSEQPSNLTYQQIRNKIYQNSPNRETETISPVRQNLMPEEKLEENSMSGMAPLELPDGSKIYIIEYKDKIYLATTETIFPIEEAFEKRPPSYIPETITNIQGNALYDLANKVERLVWNNHFAPLVKNNEESYSIFIDFCTRINKYMKNYLKDGQHSKSVETVLCELNELIESYRQNLQKAFDIDQIENSDKVLEEFIKFLKETVVGRYVKKIIDPTLRNNARLHTLDLIQDIRESLDRIREQLDRFDRDPVDLLNRIGPKFDIPNLELNYLNNPNSV